MNKLVNTKNIIKIGLAILVVGGAKVALCHITNNKRIIKVEGDK